MYLLIEYCTFVAKQGIGQGDEVVPSTKSLSTGVDPLLKLKEMFKNYLQESQTY